MLIFGLASRNCQIHAMEEAQIALYLQLNGWNTLADIGFYPFSSGPLSILRHCPDIKASPETPNK